MKSLNQIQDTHKLQLNNDQHTTQYCYDEGGEEQEGQKLRPIGNLVRISQDGGAIKNHFLAFEFDGVLYHLEDPVLVCPAEGKEKPSVAIIKDIFQIEDRDVMVSGQRFYRPEEAEKESGGTFRKHDPRELFYSHHLDLLPAETIMHRCTIHLVPSPTPLPNRKQHPGFVVRKVYDPEHRKLRDLADGDCQGSLTIKGIEASDCTTMTATSS